MAEPNSLVLFLSDYVEALFKDIASIYSHSREWRRDKQRLLHELQVNGTRVVTIDLPALDKHFCKCLDEGTYLPSRLPLGGMRKGYRVPRFLGELFYGVFDNRGVLRDAPSVECILAIRQLYSGLKKLRLKCEEWRTSNEVRDFMAIEAEIRRPTLDWVGNLLVHPSRDRLHLSDAIDRDCGAQRYLLCEPEQRCSISIGDINTIQQVADIVFSSLGDFSFESSLQGPRHGPGVVSDHRRDVYKYTLEHWPEKLDQLYPRDYYGTSDLGVSQFLDPDRLPRSSREFPSKLIAVPKTQKSPRLIASEPSAHQWIQQLLWQQLEAQISRSPVRHSVNFRSQVANQELALLGSVDGSYATIDLSSASDRLSCWLVERLARTNWSLLDRLHACRTRWLRNMIDPRYGDYIVLNKFSTMGSACIFPMQTLCYTVIACGVLLSGRKVTSKSIARVARQVRVFGDDIIVPKDACESVCKALTSFGLKINTAKTFSTGRFRESCGTDAFGGHLVTPTYLLDPCTQVGMSNIASLLETGNNFHRGGWWNVAAWLRSITADMDRFVPIVSMSDTCLGHQSFSGSSLAHLRKKWDYDLQCWTYRVLKPISRNRIDDRQGELHLLQYFTERPSPTTRWKSGHRSSLVSSMRPGWSNSHSFYSPVRNEYQRIATA